MEVKLIKDIVEFEEEVTKSTDVYYLIDKKESIEDYIENSGLEDDILLNLKVSYEVLFEGYLENKDTKQSIIVSSISEAIKNLEYNILHSYRLVLKSDNKVLMADIIQQFIYLDLKEFDIATKDELVQVLRYEKLKKNKDQLRLEIGDFRKDIWSYKTESTKIEDDKKVILDKLESLEENLTKIEERTLNVSVMATKKAGKSVIVNSFLGSEYAPTSMKLATPNTIIYQAWEKNNIGFRLESDAKLKGYEKGDNRIFTNVKEVNQHINNLFKKAAKDVENDYAMPDIYIDYPKKNLNYTIIDTPGPNLAGAGHKKIAYRWIERSDAIIFAIDYTNYLAEDEEKFLRDIKEILDEKGKFHSFIIVVNKLDLRYGSNEKKTVVGFLDFLQGRLKVLGYEGIVIMGTTSKEYFSALEFSRLLNANGIKLEKNDTIEDKIFRDLKSVKRSSGDKTLMTDIKTAITNLDIHHDVYDVTLNDIKYNSGMPALINRVKYITTTKASVEIFNNIFSKMDRSFSEIKNEFLATNIKALQGLKDEVMKDLEDVDKFFKKKEKEVDTDFTEKLKEEIDEVIDKTFNDFSKDTVEDIENTLNNKKTEVISEEQNIKISYKEITSNLEEKMNKKASEGIGSINTKKETLLDDLDISIDILNSEVKDEINKKQFKSKYKLKIELPKLSPKLAREDFKFSFDRVFKNYNNVYYDIDVMEKEIKNKKFNAFCDYVSLFGLLNTLDEEYNRKDVINEDKLEKQITEAKDDLIEDSSNAIEKKREEAKKKLHKKLDEFNEIISKELTMVIYSYQKISDGIKDKLNLSKENLEDVENFYNTIEHSFSKIENSWNNTIRVEV